MRGNLTGDGSAAALPQPTAAASAGSGDAVPGAAAVAAIGKVAPYLTVLIAVFAPLAGIIYLVTSTGWSSAQVIGSLLVSAAAFIAFVARQARLPH